MTILDGVRRTGGVAVVASLLFINPLLAGDKAPSENTVAPASDQELVDAVASAILRYPYYGVFDSVGARAENGVVTLTGSVNQPWRKDDIERRVAKVDGVKEVRNQIRVQPLSFNDDRLRAELYRRIYGNGLFARYATFADPPIRIIVENGHVTLTGYVNSEVERAVLGSIARSTLSFGVDNQVQLESESRKEHDRSESY
jgi:hyperosmotically inducible periplasmic protein